MLSPCPARENSGERTKPGCPSRAHKSSTLRDNGTPEAWLHAAAFGSPWANACVLGDPAAGQPPSDEQVAKLRQALDVAHVKLSPEQRQAVANVAVFDFVPT